MRWPSGWRGSCARVLFAANEYIGVGAAEMVEAWREHRQLWSAACVLGPVLLFWVLYRNVYPVPEFPNNLWPYVALSWVLIAWALTRLRPAITSAPLAEY